MRHVVTILGASGMLGSAILETMAAEADFRPIATLRTPRAVSVLRARHPSVQLLLFDAADPLPLPAALLGALESSSYVINAIGITKPLIDEASASDVARAIHINSLWPAKLALFCEAANTRVLQIATDCVFDGRVGGYDEGALHDAADVYGNTKSLGEIAHPAVRHLRCSIVGPAPMSGRFLLEWLVGQPHGAVVNGYRNHLWNGITTLHFARICVGIIRQDLELGHLQHVVPAGAVTKASLLRTMGIAFSRTDVAVNDFDAPSFIDRTLTTLDEDANRRIWKAAGYANPPTVPLMVRELSEWVRPCGRGWGQRRGAVPSPRI